MSGEDRFTGSSPGEGRLTRSSPGEGRYLYGVVTGGGAMSLGPIGIAHSEVYAVPCGDFRAIVHSCPATPYQSPDAETIQTWVRTHQDVLDKAQERLGSIIPAAFNTILCAGDDASSADRALENWLRDNYERLRLTMQRIEGKDEYGVQVFYDPAGLAEQLFEHSGEVRTIRERMDAASPGTAYLLRQRLERVAKAEMDRLADAWFRDLYGKVKLHCDDIVIDKTRKVAEDRVMLLNLSCLVAREKVKALGEELGKIDETEGFSVHFSGPWQPYSFTTRPAPAGGRI